MKPKTNSVGPFGGVYSGQIIRAVVQAIDIEDNVLPDRTARRFYASESVSEYNRGNIYHALGQALIDRGIAPEAVDALPEDAEMATAIGMAVGRR